MHKSINLYYRHPEILKVLWMEIHLLTILTEMTLEIILIFSCDLIMYICIVAANTTNTVVSYTVIP